MRILHVTPSYKPAYIYGGVIESVACLCEALARAGHSVDVYTTTANGTEELPVVPGSIVALEGVNVQYFRRVTKDPTYVAPELWMSLFRYCHNYDVVHIHSWWNFLAIGAAWICHLRKKRIVISPRGMLCDYIFNSTHVEIKKWLHRLVGRRALAKATFHATAESEYDECIRLIPKWKGFLLPNILPLADLDVTRKRNTVFTLLFLSRIHPKKGLELLLEGMATLPFDFRLRIAGTGDQAYISELMKRTMSLNISDKVEWIGWKDREEKFAELMDSDVFVLTSHNENFANVVIESIHVGTPVLISDRVGLASFVRENALGWVIPLDVPSIREAIISAYMDIDTRQTVRTNGRDIVARHFSAQALVGKYVRNYEVSCLVKDINEVCYGEGEC